MFRLADDRDQFRIVLALAAKRQSLDHFDVGCLGEHELSTLGVMISDCSGDTPDSHVNRLLVHLTNLSANQILGMAECIAKAGVQR